MEHPDTGVDRTRADLELLFRNLTAIRTEMVTYSSVSQTRLAETHANYRESARNLQHYLALRRRDLRPLQRRLAALGLSSLGRAESHVLATIDALLDVLSRLAGYSRQPPSPEETGIDFAGGERLLAEHTEGLLGPATPGRRVRIMVTMPGEAADDYMVVHNLLERGMDCVRINCAHDDATAWLRMIEHLRRAEHALERSCKVVMDLAGPKLRTGPLEPGPGVIRIRPRRDSYGRVRAPARVWLKAESSPHPPPSPADASLPVPLAWLARLGIGERVTLTDARDAKRIFTVVDVTEHGCWAEAIKTAYVVPGTILVRERSLAKGNDREACIGELPPAENAISLRQGELLVLTRNLKAGRPATHDSSGQLLSPAVIGCTIPEVFDDVRSGEAIWFDDGRIGGIVDKVEASQVLVRITPRACRVTSCAATKGSIFRKAPFGSRL